MIIADSLLKEIGATTRFSSVEKEVFTPKEDNNELPAIQMTEEAYNKTFLKFRHPTRQKKMVVIDGDVFAVLERITTMVFPGVRLGAYITSILENHLQEYKPFLDKKFKENLPKKLY